MKKIILGLILGSLLILPLVTSAETDIPDGCFITKGDMGMECLKYADGATYWCDVIGTPECGLCCLLNTVYTITDWVFVLMMALAVILIVIGGATYMLATGDPDKAAKGKSIITFAIIVLAIALIARFVPPVVKFIMGVN